MQKHPSAMSEFRVLSQPINGKEASSIVTKGRDKIDMEKTSKKRRQPLKTRSPLMSDHRL
ncbi:hypothetical protein BTN49_0733 [Candidatus Enterovibrio escicola]|uniref:Uncharacterized protein n=1 Tax=Candidatus Enterovibrio escicola TaxID=1927127 RepID=A0A2A5T6I7_9GAMM|nr:hypothetical protein BTN49_0733 [Candidatus Enterovibrio escacola]